MTVYFPGLLFYTEKLPAGCGGCANGPIIRIRPRYQNDKGLHEHEAEHVRQWWRTLGLHSLLYLVSRKYRLWAEVAAYRYSCKIRRRKTPVSRSDVMSNL
jgi:hypothetical protein